MNSPVLRRLLWVRGLRAFADGYVSLLLPIYLIALGMTALQVGVIATATLLGSGLFTLLVGLQAHRFTYRTQLLAACALMAATGFGFAAFSDFWPLLVVAFVGTLNPSSGDVSVFLPLEHAVLSHSVADRDRTALFARYSIVGATVAAFGSLSAGLPEVLAPATHVSMKTALQAMFGLYGAIGLVSSLIYSTLPVEAGASPQARASPLMKSKKVVYTLAALFSLDALGGGLVVQSMLALWLLQKYQLSVLFTGALFFWTGLLSALSYLIAVRIANRFGLVNTMVFTHLPVEHIFGPDSVHDQPELGHRFIACARCPVANGCADPQLVRDGDRSSKRTRSRGKRDFRAPKPCLCRRAFAGRLPAGRIALWLAAGDRRHIEDHLRFAFASKLSYAKTAGRNATQRLV